MKILFVVTDLDLGGAEAQVVALACGLKRRGHAVEVASLLDPVARTGDLDAAGVPWHSLGMKRGSADPRAVFRLARIIRRFRPDAVHSHMVHANLLTRLTRLTVRMPRLITTAHNTREGGRLLELAYRVTDPLTDLTTNVSDASVQAYLDRRVSAPGRIITVVNGLDFSPFTEAAGAREQVRGELDLSGFTWLAVARLSPEKDFPNLLAAFRELPEGTELLIVGSGPERERLEAEAGPGVRFLGRRTDVPALMAAADAFVLPSQVEGLPMVLLEAAAAGLPVVSTDVGGVAEIVSDGVTGLLVPPADSGALAAAMLRLQEAPAEERGRLAAAARAHALATYDLDRVLDRWEELYVAGN